MKELKQPKSSVVEKYIQIYLNTTYKLLVRHNLDSCHGHKMEAISVK